MFCQPSWLTRGKCHFIWPKKKKEKKKRHLSRRNFSDANFYHYWQCPLSSRSWHLERAAVFSGPIRCAPAAAHLSSSVAAKTKLPSDKSNYKRERAKKLILRGLSINVQSTNGTPPHMRYFNSSTAMFSLASALINLPLQPSLSWKLHLCFHQVKRTAS